MPSTTNLEEEEIVDALGNDGNASMPEEVKRPNLWRKMMMMMMMIMMMITMMMMMMSYLDTQGLSQKRGPRAADKHK